MMKVNVSTMHPLLSRYLNNQNNSAEGYPTDVCGRFVLPMDNVTYSYKTDEGVEVLLSSTVAGVYGSFVEMVDNDRFNMSSNFILSSKCIKHPQDSYLSYLLYSYVLNFNAMVILTNMKPLHINGVRI